MPQPEDTFRWCFPDRCQRTTCSWTYSGRRGRHERTAAHTKVALTRSCMSARLVSGRRPSGHTTRPAPPSALRLCDVQTQGSTATVTSERSADCLQRFGQKKTHLKSPGAFVYSLHQFPSRQQLSQLLFFTIYWDFQALQKVFTTDFQNVCKSSVM